MARPLQLGAPSLESRIPHPKRCEIGCSVRVASDAPSSLRQAFSFRPDLVLIAVTAFHASQPRATFDRYLRKPFDFEQVVEVVMSEQRFDPSSRHAAE
jgi:hypothetical protein